MKVLTHGSLFAGIGGFDLGFERAGFKTVWQVEIDEYCRKVLARHFTDAERFADIRDCGKHNLRAVDVLTGGFPCQDISVAGEGAGIDGARSGLWKEMWRVICELRPRIVVVENVSALLDRGMERVLSDLAAGGYDTEWDCLPAVAFGAPHRRDRVFILAYSTLIGRQGESEIGIGDGSNRERVFAESTGGGSVERSGIVADSAECEGNVICADGINGESQSGKLGRNGCEDGRDWWAVEPSVGRVANGVPARVDRLKGLGNAVVPQIAEWIANRILAANGGGD